MRVPRQVALQAAAFSPAECGSALAAFARGRWRDRPDVVAVLVDRLGHSPDRVAPAPTAHETTVQIEGARIGCTHRVRYFLPRFSGL